jgi:NRPS condensation-like uncharacterized protein
MTFTPLNVLDELYLNLDRAAEPWTTHYEVHVRSHLDADRLAGAIAVASARHPFARARLASWRFQDRSYVWEVADQLDEMPLKVTVCNDENALAQERERLFSTSPSLGTAPPFAIVLARCGDRDVLLVNMHHAVADGVSAARLVLSIMRAYAGEDDPLPPVDPLAAHDVRALAAARSTREQSARRHALLADAAWRSLMQTARVAREGGDDRPAYGFELFALSVDESRKVFDGHPHRTTVNDLLLAALAAAIDRWNAEHGRRAGPIALSMPINLRPAAWRFEIVSNFASWVTVWVRPEPGEDVSSIATRVATTTRAIKRDGLGGSAVDLLTIQGDLMIAAKRWLHYVKAFSSDIAVDTASLSNFGRLDPLPASFDGIDAAVWAAPPSQMPLGVGIGVVTVGDRLHVGMRYRHAQFDRAAARKFMDLYRAVLLGQERGSSERAQGEERADRFLINAAVHTDLAERHNRISVTNELSGSR